MNCKYCGAEVPDGKNFCPNCGKAQDETEQTVKSVETVAEEAAPERNAAEPVKETKAAPEADEAAAKKEKKKTGWILGAAIAVLVIIIALLVVKIVRDSQIKNVDTATTEETQSDAAEPSDTPDDKLDSSGDGETAGIPLNGVSYTVTADEMTEDVLNRVVAVCGDVELTNRELPIYYWQQYMSFANAYGMYLSYLMDTSLPLDQQMYDEEHTWQQQFLDSALSMFQYHASAAQEAEKAGYTLSAESEQTLAAMPADLETAAAGYGFESTDEYLQASYGPGMTLDVYMKFLRQYLLGSEYLSSLIDAQAPTDEEISQYYDDNAESYEASRVEKIDKPMVSVRHILVEPEASEDGTISDEAWAEAEKTANDILDQWLAGEQTEESFAALANEHSADPGSNTNGGLYEDVYPGQMVETFNDWCFADGRQVGDYGIVKTDYGYHIMFFSGVGEEIYWRVTAKEDYLSELAAQMQDEIAAKYEFTPHVDQAALVDMLFQDTETSSAE